MSQVPKNDPGFVNIPSEQENKYLTNAGAHKPGMRNEEVVDYYTSWAQKYDQDLNSDVYKGPQIAANTINDLLSSNKDSKILDVGAGTGFVGEFLVEKHGFRNIDALEPSKGMCEVAAAKNVYKNIYTEGIYADKQTSLPSDSYDAVVLAGALGEGHIPSEGMNELARLAKPNGHVVIVMRKEYLTYVKEYVNRLEPIMKSIEEKNIWKLVSRTEVENYSFNKTGLVFIFQKN